MELSDIIVREREHGDETVPKCADNKVKEHPYVNSSFVADTDMNVKDRHENHVYEHLQRSHDNASNCKMRSISRFQQYKDCSMFSLIAVLFLVAVTALAIAVIGLSEKTDQSVHGGWSVWGSWSECSVSCSTELTTRNRSCSNPKPSNDGYHCLGDSTEYKLCDGTSCSAVDGGWSAWSAWGTCSATCGAGLQSRNRTCSNPAPELHGRPCVGDFSENQLCAPTVCPALNGGWSDWSAWGNCSATCGTGLQRRHRTCSNPTPDRHGRPCVGDFSDYQHCAITPCYVWTNRNCKDWMDTGDATTGFKTILQIRYTYT